MIPNINICMCNQTLAFAADELAGYLEKITGCRPRIYSDPDGSIEPPGFVIRCEDTPGRDTKPDEFEIRTEKGMIVLSGNRPRSCLYAVYAYLEEQGVRFLRPGPDGAVVPKRNRLKAGIRKHERASHDHRCICMEGAVSIEHALAVVDWMAKHRMNEFQLQFETSIFFWNRWYTHELNPRFGDHSGKQDNHKKITVAQSEEYDNILIDELEKRNIDVHRMGHGWTCNSLGIPAMGWDKTKIEVPPELRDRIALVNGKREWHRGVPSNTELCYSNQDAFYGVVQTVVDYAVRHPEADVLLFCLADGMNQHCECKKCAELSVSDWYTKLVNAISEALSERGLKTKLSFDAYANTVQAPEVEYVQDKFGNLIFMFAPFFRCYEHPLADPKCMEDYPVGRIERNHVPFVASNRAYVQLLRQWQTRNMADSFLADYHFWRLSNYFLDEMFVARLVYKDMTDLMKLGHNGIFSCQVLRSFYPSALGMTVMAAALWDRTLTFEEIAERHLKAAYGPFASRVTEYLAGITAILKPTPHGHDHLICHANNQSLANKAISYLASSADKLKKMQARAGKPVYARSLEYLMHYNTLLSLLCQAAERFAAGDIEGCQAKLDEATLFACNTEEQTHWVLDTWMLNFWHTERIARWKYGDKKFVENWFLQDERH